MAGMIDEPLMKPLTVAAIVAALALLSGRSAHAQSTASGSHSKVHAGKVVWITPTDGFTLQVKTVAVSDTQLVVSILGDVKAYRWPEIRRIEAPDSIANGLIIGAIFGGLVGYALDHPFVFGGIGAAMGGWGDHLREGRKVIYTGASPTVSVSPAFGPKTIGVSAVVRW
jgi:hypothetical protein